MKRFLLIVSLFLTAHCMQAQSGSWKVKLNNKLLLSTDKEDEKANSKKLKSSEWKKNGWLEISFKETNLNTWRRSFLFFDEEDNQLLARDSVTWFRISNSSLRKLFAGKKEIRIYTIISPLDPNLAIRMRRVHLYTLRLP